MGQADRVSGVNLKGRPKVIVALIALAAVLIVGSVYGVQWWRAERACNTARSLEEKRGGDTEPVTQGSPVYVVLGDSYAQGWLLDNPLESWPTTMGEDLGAEVWVDAVSGSGLVETRICAGTSIRDRLDDALAQNPDVLVVQTGINDSNTGPDQITSAIDEVAAASDGVRLVIVGPPTLPSGDQSDAVDAAGQVIEAAADAVGVQYVDLTRLDLPYLPDETHVTADGQRMIGEYVANQIARG